MALVRNGCESTLVAAGLAKAENGFVVADASPANTVGNPKLKLFGVLSSRRLGLNLTLFGDLNSRCLGYDDLILNH